MKLLAIVSKLETKNEKAIRIEKTFLRFARDCDLEFSDRGGRILTDVVPAITPAKVDRMNMRVMNEYFSLNPKAALV